jgi:hypothetical protein
MKIQVHKEWHFICDSKSSSQQQLRNKIYLHCHVVSRIQISSTQTPHHHLSITPSLCMYIGMLCQHRSLYRGFDYIYIEAILADTWIQGLRNETHPIGCVLLLWRKD